MATLKASSPFCPLQKPLRAGKCQLIKYSLGRTFLFRDLRYSTKITDTNLISFSLFAFYRFQLCIYFFSLSLISFGQAHKIYPAENHQNLLQMHIFCLHICSALNIIERKKKKRKRKKVQLIKDLCLRIADRVAPLLMILTTFSGHQLQPVSFRYCLKIKN